MTMTMMMMMIIVYLQLLDMYLIIIQQSGGE